MLVNQIHAFLLIELPLIVKLVHLRLNIIKRHALVFALLTPIAFVHFLIQNRVQKLSPLEVLLVFIIWVIAKTMRS